MRVRCLNCGLVLEAVMGEGICPECGCNCWGGIIEGSKEKMSIEDLEKVKNDYINNPIYHGNYEVGLFMIQIIDILKDLIKEQQNIYKELAQKKSVNFDHLEMLKDFLQQMNKDYRNFIERHLLADLPIDPVDFSNFYQSQLERIMNIKI